MVDPFLTAFPQTERFVETQRVLVSNTKSGSLRWHLVCRIVGAVTAATRSVASTGTVCVRPLAILTAPAPSR